MSVGATILSILLAIAFAGSGVAKLIGARAMRASAEHLGYSYPAFRLVGVAELAGAAGLAVGLAYHPLGVAAAIGLVALTAGAVISHLRVKDPAKVVAGPALFGLLALAIVVLVGTA